MNGDFKKKDIRRFERVGDLRFGGLGLLKLLVFEMRVPSGEKREMNGDGVEGIVCYCTL